MSDEGGAPIEVLPGDVIGDPKSAKAGGKTEGTYLARKGGKVRFVLSNSVTFETCPPHLKSSKHRTQERPALQPSLRGGRLRSIQRCAPRR